MRAWLALVGCAAFCLGAPPATAGPGPDAQSDNPESQIIQNVIVEWEPGVARPDRVQARAEAGATGFLNLGSTRFQLLQLADDRNVADALDSLRADPNVAVASRDGYSVLHAAQPNDPLFGELWGLLNTGAGIHGFGGAVVGDDINALNAWDKTVGDASVIVADLDTGYRWTHPDLATAPVWTNPADPQDGVDNDANGVADDTYGIDFVGANADAIVWDGDATDDIYAGGHGVHTAGTIGAPGNNGIGITGVAQRTTILPIRVCGLSSGGVLCPFSSQIAGINYAGAHGARVANMSLGGITYNLAVRDALAHNPNTLFVISSGNDTHNTEVAGQTTYPCSYDPRDSGGAVDNVICVAATDQADHIASFSNWGKVKVDLAAPGTEILSTIPSHPTRSYQDFESASWPYSGWTAGSWTRTNVSPLTSYGITNATSTQGATATRTVRTANATTPYPGPCRLYQRRTLTLGGTDTYAYRIYVDGAQVFSSQPSASGYYYGDFTVFGAGSHTLAAEFSYTRNNGATTNGAWLDDIGFYCLTTAGHESAVDYDYLDGTSMAAPHVSGAAALLAALEPTATVNQMRQALLTTVDPVADLNPNTGTHPVATGGRLDANSALGAIDALVAPNTAITGQSVSGTSATIAFATSDTNAPATFECSMDGAGFSACGSPSILTGLLVGTHSYAVRAKDAYGNVDPSPAIATWTTAAVKPPLAAPGQVSRVKVKRLKKKAVITWQAAPGATSYKVRSDQKTKTVAGTKFTLKKLKPGKKYRVSVTAVNAAGSGPGVWLKVPKFR